MEKVSVFISYSHADEAYKDTLVKHLVSLKRNGIISTWDDRELIPGQEWDDAIKQELDSSAIILLLVSVDFLNSGYSNDVEIKRAIERHRKGEAVVIPVILRSCDWQGSSTSFSMLQALPKDGVPVKKFNDEDAAFLEITQGIKKAVSLLKKKANDDSESVNNKTNEGNIIQSNNILNLYTKPKNECDTPPNNQFWIGREDELRDIDSNLHKVVFISGMGGQGKSGLASHYVKEFIRGSEVWEFWDWRDCKETENRIHTKVTSAIERLSNGSIQVSQLINESFEDILELFFNILDKRSIVFVFDNVDAYVELENFQLTGPVERLYQSAINKNHNSKFIFTCRTSINDIHVQLLSIRLQGLTESDTLKLFEAYRLPFNSNQIGELSQKSFNLTNGHPLWLTLIAAQARKGLEAVDRFMNGIKLHSNFKEDDLASMLSDKILKVIWDTLNENQKILLRAFAEIVKAENQQNLSKILDSEMTGNHFFKAFKALKQLNLIVTKSSSDEPDTFELHPLVREYVVKSFVKKDRSKYIILFVKYYDYAISILKKQVKLNQPLSFFENWTAKVELSINIDDYKTALSVINEISGELCDSGYVEEYIRVSTLLFVTIDWPTAIREEYSFFHVQINAFITSLTYFGKYSDAKAFLIKYQKNILGKNKDYIEFCETKAYFHWFQDDFEKAIEAAEEGLALEKQSGTKPGIGLIRNLALALRDTREENNINKALSLFLGEFDLKEVIHSDALENTDGELYGNIGRCLQYLDRQDEAIACYKKSMPLLDTALNKGYCYLWIAEILLQRNNLTDSAWFLQRAYNSWKSISPIKAEAIKKKRDALIEISPLAKLVIEASPEDVDKYCRRYLNQQMITLT